jgi:F-type H+-transporting ATPase subunit b
MDVILQQLGVLLLKAIPTFVLVLLLHYYLKFVFFKPLETVLERRYEATEGARKLAEQSMKDAEAKTAQYEAAIRAARSEIYQGQEQVHKQLQEHEAAELAAARQQAEEAIQRAKAALATDVEAAKAGLARESESLANEIVAAIIRGSAA